MMLALTGLLSHQNLPSRTILVLTTLLERRLAESFLVPNHRFLCLSNNDFIVTNVNSVARNSVPTCLVILMTRIPRRLSFFRNYFVHNFLRLCQTEKEILNEFTLPLLNGVEKKTARSHAYRNRFKLGHHLEVGQKVLYENRRQDLSKSQELQQRRLGPFTVSKRVTSTTYQIQDNKDQPTHDKNSTP